MEKDEKLLVELRFSLIGWLTQWMLLRLLRAISALGKQACQLACAALPLKGPNLFRN